MAKCPKCENGSFNIEKRKDTAYCYVVCNKCNTIVGILEDIDFKEHSAHVIRNHGFFEKRINDLEEKLTAAEKREKEMLEMIEYIVNKIDRNVK